MVYYPNIQCILCEEWVCSRNRYMHIESHLQYKPYKCSVCGYDNRKEIFISLHIARVHQNNAKILYQPDQELEQKAWKIAENCLQHTRQVLANQAATATRKVEGSQGNEAVEHGENGQTTLNLDKYESVYRPKIFNSQRAEKTQIIEASRELGLLCPAPQGIVTREVSCRLCGAYIVKSYISTEEHARSHLGRASYACAFSGCHAEHWSRNFMQRHIKEVHRIRKSPKDLIECDRSLRLAFIDRCRECFPKFYTGEPLNRLRHKYAETGLGAKRGDATSASTEGHIRPKRGRPRSVASLIYAGGARTQNPHTANDGPNEETNNSGGFSQASGPVEDNSAPSGDPDCLGCEIGLTLDNNASKVASCINCRLAQQNGAQMEGSSADDPSLQEQCSVCSSQVRGSILMLLCHSLAHLRPLPFGCSMPNCVFSHWDCREVQRHCAAHESSSASVAVNFHEQGIKDRWLESTALCFGDKFLAKYHSSKARSTTALGKA